MAVSISPGSKGVAVTPSDSTTLGGCRGLYVGGTGDLIVDFADSGGTNITFKAVPTGTVLPIAPLRVKAATTATQIVALY